MDQDDWRALQPRLIRTWRGHCSQCSGGCQMQKLQSLAPQQEAPVTPRLSPGQLARSGKIGTGELEQEIPTSPVWLEVEMPSPRLSDEPETHVPVPEPPPEWGATS